MTIKEQLLALTRQLLPTGRAFRIGYNSLNESVEKALILSEERAYNDGLGILDSILPDNDNFTVEDATRWEERLGMITNDLVPLQDRKDAIIRKMNHPGTILARQSAGYIQDSLQLAGFNVWIHENIPAQTVQSALLSVSGSLQQLGGFQLGQQNLGNVYTVNFSNFTFFQLGNFQLGQQQLNGWSWNNKIANHIDEQKDTNFNYGTLRRTFFVGGQILGTFASVPDSRKDEFRQLLLKLKPTQTVGFLFVNYI